jgi:hypothetical protein
VGPLRAANARLREVIEDKDAQLAAAGAALEAAQAQFAALSERVAELERCRCPFADRAWQEWRWPGCQDPCGKPLVPTGIQ